jgi:ribosomal protein S18 acetylase RimI-like enzyme
VEQVWGWDDAQQREFFDRRFRPERLQVVESGGEPVGVLSIGEEENALFLADVEIAPEWQRRGIGSAIVRSLQERARAEGRPLELQVLRVNERARALYERLGFREIRHDEIRARMRWPSENVLSPDEGDLSPL